MNAAREAARNARAAKCAVFQEFALPPSRARLALLTLCVLPMKRPMNMKKRMNG
jgi:hypothetical protein